MSKYGEMHEVIVETIRRHLPYLVRDVPDDIGHAVLEALADEFPEVPVRDRAYFYSSP